MKISHDMLQKIRLIEIQTKRLLRGSLVGDYSSCQKGSGLDFDQIRSYQVGDDIRFIDWKASARTGDLLIKQYQEERSRTVIVVLDTSSSMFYGSTDVLKIEQAAEIASIFALVAEYGKDYVGALTFDREVKRFHQAKRGLAHVQTILESFFQYDLQSEQEGETSFATMLKHLMAIQKQQAIVIIVSDFMGNHYEKWLRPVAKKHEVIAVRCLDVCEKIIPKVGIMPLRMKETAEVCYAQTSGYDAQSALDRYHEDVRTMLVKSGADVLDVSLDRPFVGDIVRFFRRRMRY